MNQYMGKDPVPIYQRVDNEGRVNPTKHSPLRNSILNDNYGAKKTKVTFADGTQKSYPNNRISNAQRN